MTTQPKGQEGWDRDLHGRMLDAADSEQITTDPYDPAKDPFNKGEVAYDKAPANRADVDERGGNRDGQ